MKRSKLTKNNKGSVMAFMLIIFLVIAILTTSIIFVFNTNLKQAKRQQHRMEAYYLAYSGIEMGYNALVQDRGNDQGKRADDLRTGIKDEYVANIKFGNGNISIVAIKNKEDNLKDWIKITSTGVLNNGISYTRNLYFDSINVTEKIWKSN